jgi:hypothetical protein
VVTNRLMLFGHFGGMKDVDCEVEIVDVDIPCAASIPYITTISLLLKK